ncbi:4Fe-4S binding protein [Candidatus Dependentiae bacterium]|nr:4Fe-4S binding protein [Candidatus Dependentiae bacterium]
MDGVILKAQNNDFNKGIKSFLLSGLKNGVFDSFILSMQVPAKDSYAWILTYDEGLVKSSTPISPIMTVQGARALKSLRTGTPTQKIAVVMRPCEMRAVIELSKLNQINLNDLILISYDCPGTLPIKNYLEDPEKGEEVFNKILLDWDDKNIRETCKLCDKVSVQEEKTFQSDLHITTLGIEQNNFAIISNSEKGIEILNELKLEIKNLSSRDEPVKKIIETRRKNRENSRKELIPQLIGLDALSEFFSKCINCKVCRSVCPICYCRQCYFSSEKVKYSMEDYLLQASTRGNMKFLPSLLFQVGRMTHMSLSCVNCGACEDACPMDIKVGQAFSYVGDNVQKLFDYLPGRSFEEPLPLSVYREEEFKEIEN